MLSVLCNLQLSKEFVRVLMAKYYSGVDRLKRVHAPPGNFFEKIYSCDNIESGSNVREKII